MLIAIWSLAGLALAAAARSYSANRAKAAEVAELEARYGQEMDDYASVLLRGEKLAEDQDFRIRLLKDRFGYTEPDETPIVILEDPEQRSSLEIE